MGALWPKLSETATPHLSVAARFLTFASENEMHLPARAAAVRFSEFCACAVLIVGAPACSEKDDAHFSLALESSIALGEHSMSGMHVSSEGAVVLWENESVSVLTYSPEGKLSKLSPSVCPGAIVAAAYLDTSASVQLINEGFDSVCEVSRGGELLRRYKLQSARLPFAATHDGQFWVGRTRANDDEYQLLRWDTAGNVLAMSRPFQQMANEKSIYLRATRSSVLVSSTDPLGAVLQLVWASPDSLPLPDVVSLQNTLPDTIGLWVAMPAFHSGTDVLQMLTDLRSDRRMLRRNGLSGPTSGAEMPVGLSASASNPSRIYALHKLDGFHLLVYRRESKSPSIVRKTP